MSLPLMLPGQQAAPDGPADMTMMYVLHHAFRRDLRDFTAVTATVSPDDAERWRCVEARWRLFVDELTAHHTKEDDVLWPLLLERASATGDDAAVRVLEEMEEEHAVLDPLLSSCSKALSVLARGVTAAEGTPVRDVLRRDLDELGTALGSHLGHEEEAAIAILQRYVGGEEWDELERRKMRGDVSLRRARQLFPWAAKGLPDDALTRVRAVGGPGVGVLLAVFGGGFARRDRAAFGG